MILLDIDTAAVRFQPIVERIKDQGYIRWLGTIPFSPPKVYQVRTPLPNNWLTCDTSSLRVHKLMKQPSPEGAAQKQIATEAKRSQLEAGRFEFHDLEPGWWQNWKTWFTVLAEVVAQQLTQIEHTMFIEIGDSEFLHLNWKNEKLKKKVSPNIVKLVDRFNAVTNKGMRVSWQLPRWAIGLPPKLWCKQSKNWEKRQFENLSKSQR